jgi:hypothetical protein
VIEATMTAALFTQGMTAGPAAAVVLACRLISHWLPIVVGLIVYLAAGTGSGPQPAEPGAPTRGFVVRVGETITAGQRASWLTEPPARFAPCGHS